MMSLTRRSFTRFAVPGRTYSSVRDLSSLPASIQAWISDITTAPTRTNNDLIDLSRAQGIHVTLPTRAEQARLPEKGDALGKGWTLCYHWDKGFVQDLGEDGTSRSFNAPSPYTRRMWASGSFSFPSTARPLCIGDSSVESTRIAKVEYKPKKDLVFVHQEKTYARLGEEEEVLVKEQRVHVFRRAVKASSNVPPASEPAVPASTPGAAPSTLATPEYTFTYAPNAAHLFRFSALTFNGHKIHYDPIWTRDVEGHPGGIVVHGPLTALTMLECASEWAERTGREVQEFYYRAISPMYAGKDITFNGRNLPIEMGQGDHAGQLEIWAEQEGRVGMRGVATLRTGTGK